MKEFPVKGILYRSKRMDAKKQFHVTRRLTPFIVGMIAVLPQDAIRAAMSADKKTIDLDSVISSVDPFTMIQPIMENMAKMPDADVDFVLDTCLEHCERSLGNDKGWATVKLPGAAPQYQDIDMIAMLQISWGVIQGNVGNFFPVPSLNSTEPKTATA